MTRVIAGAAGGRRLAVPPGTGTRPTSDRAREGLFSTWESLLGTLERHPRRSTCTRGSGAVGLEALSRGAAHALLVEADAAGRPHRPGERPRARPARRRGPCRQSRADRDGTGARRTRTTWSSSTRRTPSPTTIFGEILLTLRAQGWLTDDALVTVERSTRGGEFGWPEGFEPLRARRYGEGTLWYGRAASTCEDAR